MTAISTTTFLPKKSNNLISFSAIGYKLFTCILKVAKSLKFILAAGTAATYTFLFTWKFALLVMLGIGLHEMGHVWAMRRCGMQTKGFYFIPFVGGAAVADDAFKSGKDEIFIALMGPVVGLLTAIPPLILYGITKSPMWAAAASWLCVVNLFNLFPINPLDGGRFIKGIAFSLSTNVGIIVMGAGFALAGALAFKTGMSLLWFVAIVGMLEIRPFGAWLVLMPFGIVVGIILTPILFVFWGVGAVSSYWVVLYEMLVIDQKGKPIIAGTQKMGDHHWDLSSVELAKYTGLYVGLIIVFVTIISMLSHVPGADIGHQFLHS
jgi:Zn-dependent protease